MVAEMAYKNYAFISYSHRDIKIARWLQKRLEHFRLPSEIHNEIEAEEKYLRPIFRDESDLSVGNLSDMLEENLKKSKFLILICSEHSATSEWVSKETEIFVNLGRLKQIIPIIVSDNESSGTELFPNYLRNIFETSPEKELLGVTLSEGKEKALNRVVSRMLDISFDSIWQRHLRQKRKTVFTWFICSAIIALSLYTFALPIYVRPHINLENSNLPISNKIEIIIDGAKYLTSAHNSEITPIRLPGYKRFTKSHIIISSKYFATTDSLFNVGFGVKSNLYINLLRDKTFAVFAGNVFNEDMQPLQGVLVKVCKIVSITNNQGFFYISIPLHLQKEFQEISIEKDGYKSLLLMEESPGSELKYILHNQ